ncbi:MAG: hypothetical protein IJH85_08515, partial [Clostridia bacterium]|nr:hypothetical protein [Clostridia bacterium]
LSRFSNLALLLGGLFLLVTVLAWLQMYGLNLPQLKLPRMKRKDPPFLTGDLADHLDDDLVSFDDLDAEDQAFCVFLADALLALLCLGLALVL